jgi:hypothetical protein
MEEAPDNNYIQLELKERTIRPSNSWIAENAVSTPKPPKQKSKPTNKISKKKINFDLKPRRRDNYETIFKDADRVLRSVNAFVNTKLNAFFASLGTLAGRKPCIVILLWIIATILGCVMLFFFKSDAEETILWVPGDR